MELPKISYEMVIISHMLLGGTQSKLTNLNSLFHRPKVTKKCKKKKMVDYLHPLSIKWPFKDKGFIRSS